MTTFTIDPENNITAFANSQEAEAAANRQSFARQDDLSTLTASWPMDRFVTVWNSFAGVAGFGADLKPVKKFENRDKAVARIWKARLNRDATVEDATTTETANAALSLREPKTRPPIGKEGKKPPAKKVPKAPRAKVSKPAKANPACRGRAARPLKS